MNNQQQQLCVICMTGKSGLQYSFAQCNHKQICLKCCEKQIITAVQKENYPKCIQESCQEFMVDEGGKNYIFQYLSDNVKTIWKKAKIKGLLKNKSISPPCTVPDCPGIIKAGKCLKCCQFYCEKCYKIEHTGKCKDQSEDLTETDSLKQIYLYQRKCPNPKCKIFIERQSGCLKMKCDCGHQFCYECRQEWTKNHEFVHGLKKGILPSIGGWFSENLGCFSEKKKPKRQK